MVLTRKICKELGILPESSLNPPGPGKRQSKIINYFPKREERMSEQTELIIDEVTPPPLTHPDWSHYSKEFQQNSGNTSFPRSLALELALAEKPEENVSVINNQRPPAELTTFHQDQTPTFKYTQTELSDGLFQAHLQDINTDLSNIKNYLTITNGLLLTHASKVMLKILQGRLKQYVDRELPEVQAGFRRGRGTRDQIANMRWIMEKAREFQKDIYFCFIDYAKAFDCVDHSKLWQVLKEMGVPDHLICLLRNLYVGQEATVRTGYGTTDWFKIGKGVRQGCILSPCLFNLYAEFIMRKAGLDESQAGIKISGRNINNLRYADDTTLMAESEEELKNLLMRVKEESAKYGLKLNIKKTKIMATGPITSWQIEGEEMEAVRDFIFLGSMITADGDSSHEIKRRLLLGRKAMANLDNILKSRDITLPTKVRIVKAMVFPVVMYGSESWTIKKADRRRIDAFELWCWRRLLRVPWTARRSNASILKEIRPECSLEGQIVKLRLQYFGHLMRREDSLEKTLMLGKMEGTRKRGRQRMRWLDSVLEATNMSLTKLREAVEDRSAWRALVHGVTKSRTRLND
uniref:ribonuclease H n=1 Tax=Podarcis muralis TaxID=64176 RepID=A0A670JQE1_PODMU